MASYLLKYTVSKMTQTLLQQSLHAIQTTGPGGGHSHGDQILEPVSTVIKLAMISFKEDGTKIAISNHKMYIQSPSLFQGTIRTMFGHNREEIHHLLKPIVRALDIYPALAEGGEIINAPMLHVYKLAIEGLKKLKRNYGVGSSTVSHSIDLYISIIDGHIGGGSKLTVDSIHGISLDDSIDEHPLLDIDHLYDGLWEASDFELISRMFQSATTCKENSAVRYYIDSIHNIIKAKENVGLERLEKIQHTIVR